MLSPQFILPIADKLVIDLFAGGGGASTGIEQAIGRHVDIAVNHDADAIGMHEVNHPQTRHYRADVWEVAPLVVTEGRPVGLLHASPDCTDHSQAKGGQPREQAIRALAWVVHRWAGKVKPDVITLENVEQMLRWSNLIAKRDRATGRVVTLDVVMDAAGKKHYRVAEPGERVPRHRQFLVPDEKRLGVQWQRFVAGLRAMGYKVEWRVICNADLGAHSTRTRLYMIARRDGLPIVWPEKTHAKKPTSTLKRHRPAADCINFSIEGASIFERKKPLAEATMRRIAYGLKKFVIDSPEPFIVGVGGRMGQSPSRPVSKPMQTITAKADSAIVVPTLVPVTHTRDTAHDVQQPLRTITTAKGGEQALAAAVLVQMGHGQGIGKTARRSHGANDVTGPLGTVTASGGGHGIAAAFMVQANGGFNSTPARDLRRPVSAITASGSQQQLITAQLANGLSPEHEAGALRCAAFLINYYGNGTALPLRDPVATVTTHDRLALVTVWLKGEPWVIVDITLRMLMPRELYNAQDFPASYVIDRTASGKALTKTAQVRMCGNSVSPLPMRLIVSANYRSDAAAVRKQA